jgi:prepilin-type N-terminal cleavage/methylation domain-containing protein
MQRVKQHSARNDRGMTLVEMMIALVVLAVGILAYGRMFPTAARSQNGDRLLTTASGFAQQKLEELASLAWTDPALSNGAHPAGGVADTLAGGGCVRTYQVITLPIPMDNIKRVIVTVNWTIVQGRSLRDTLYLRM